jgi:hypothetical protein
VGLKTAGAAVHERLGWRMVEGRGGLDRIDGEEEVPSRRRETRHGGVTPAGPKPRFK